MLGQRRVTCPTLFETNCEVYVQLRLSCTRRTEFSMVHTQQGERLFEFDLQMLPINFRIFFPRGEKSQQVCSNRDLNPGPIAQEARIRTTVPRSPSFSPFLFSFFLCYWLENMQSHRHIRLCIRIFIQNYICRVMSANHIWQPIYMYKCTFRIISSSVSSMPTKSSYHFQMLLFRSKE